MFGLDNAIAHFSDGVTLLLVIGVAILLGLRHAADPDHLVAVSTLIAGKKEHSCRLAARLGFSWGLGHATSLFACGLPIVLYRAYLPKPVLESAETLIGLLIIALAVCLLVRCRRGRFHLHAHEHDSTRHFHLHSHRQSPTHAHRHTIRTRSPLQAYAIGVVHGIGGGAGVGILLLATIHSHGLAAAALALFAFFTAASMALLSSGLGLALTSRRGRRTFQLLAPALATTSLAFGTWYALAALNLAPHHF
jgi:high-affinity nickel permease